MSKEFEYSKKWYEDVYHAELKNPNYIPDPKNFHPERDIQCLQDLGVKPEHLILMCGCGGGDDIYLLDKEFDCHNITGIDFSETAINFCNRYFDWVKAYCTCVSEIPFDDNTFDILCALDVTEHLPIDTYLFFLFEAYRVLKVGGRIAVLPGQTNRPEHINILSLPIIAFHMRKIGFTIPIHKNEWIIGEKVVKERKLVGEGKNGIVS